MPDQKPVYRTVAARRIAEAAESSNSPVDADEILSDTGAPSRKARKAIGRPLKPAGTTARIGALPADWRNLLRIVKLARAAPRAEATQAELADAEGWITRKLGPAIDPDFVPDNRATRTVYRVTAVDRTEHEYTEINEAAQALGVTAGTLSVSLTRGGGKYRRTIWVMNKEVGEAEPHVAKCERVKVLLDDD